jgi:hypothetical protein
MELSDLRAAFENEGYEVGDVSRNRGRVRVVIVEEGAPAEELRSIAEWVAEDTDIFGLQVTSESVDGQPGMNTVVTFRER